MEVDGTKNRESNLPHYAALQGLPSTLDWPSAWSAKEKYTFIDLSSGDLQALYKGMFSKASPVPAETLYLGPGKSDGDAAAIRANRPIPSCCAIFYYEVKIISKGRDGYVFS